MKCENADGEIRSLQKLVWSIILTKQSHMVPNFFFQEEELGVMRDQMQRETELIATLAERKFSALKEKSGHINVWALLNCLFLIEVLT